VAEPRDPDQQAQEADKITMDFFKQVGTYSLAGAVLLATLFSAFGEPNNLLVTAVVGGVLLFSVSLCLCVGGMLAVAEKWGPSEGARIMPTRDKTITLLRFTAAQTFLGGAVSFFIAIVGLMFLVHEHLP
jgi:hypothetical protein